MRHTFRLGWTSEIYEPIVCSAFVYPRNSITDILTGRHSRCGRPALTGKKDEHATESRKRQTRGSKRTRDLTRDQRTPTGRLPQEGVEKVGALPERTPMGYSSRGLQY